MIKKVNKRKIAASFLEKEGYLRLSWMVAEGSRLLREKQQIFMVGRVSAVPTEDPAESVLCFRGSIDEGRLKPPFAGNVDIPLAGAPAESDYLERTSY
ncbi:hypothetical protein JOC34_003721 [Virgibacillus halotolerans]|nr:hypothetical protein [Virgibacillus halotolerans]